MSDALESYDILVIGGGPSGQKAAIQGAKAGKRVLLVEQEASIGGECVHHGTIPSKTLRESALNLMSLRKRMQGVIDSELPADAEVAHLMHRLSSVRENHERFRGAQIARNGIERWRGRARFVSPDTVCVHGLGGSERQLRADLIVLATGSRPRRPKEIAIDHENVLDSDSILSLIYLPRSLTILGGGVIACEFASIFGALGVDVTMAHAGERPLSFLDPELTQRFVAAFEESGGRLRSGRHAESVRWNGVDAVETELDDGETLASEKVMCALGRVANVAGLELGAAGLTVNERGLLEADEHGRTSVPHIYAVGDVIGPPALAATAVEQGRHAVRHALGLPLSELSRSVPIGIYTIPEMASIGLTEADAIAAHGSAVVGRASFSELARAHISGNTEGLLKLVADPEGKRLVGAQIVGEGATELIHMAQLAIYTQQDVDVFVDNVLNFPTLAEGYRVAAISVIGAREELRRTG